MKTSLRNGLIIIMGFQSFLFLINIFYYSPLFIFKWVMAVRLLDEGVHSPFILQLSIQVPWVVFHYNTHNATYTINSHRRIMWYSSAHSSPFIKEHKAHKGCYRLKQFTRTCINMREISKGFGRLFVWHFSLITVTQRARGQKLKQPMNERVVCLRRFPKNVKVGRFAIFRKLSFFYLSQSRDVQMYLVFFLSVLTLLR